MLKNKQIDTLLSYRSYRSFLGLMIITLACGLTFDRILTEFFDIQTVKETLNVLLSQYGSFGALLTRLYDSGYKIFLFVLFVSSLLYGVFQFVGVTRDKRLLFTLINEPKNTLITSYSVISILTGRPAFFYQRMLHDKEQTKVVEHFNRHFESGYNELIGPLNACFWGFPLLGFLGTITGLSVAIKHLPAAIESGELEPVLVNLYLAFDTTMIGLIGSLILYFLIQQLENSWNRLEVIFNKYFIETNIPSTCNEPVSTAINLRKK